MLSIVANLQVQWYRNNLKIEKINNIKEEVDQLRTNNRSETILSIK